MPKNNKYNSYKIGFQIINEALRSKTLLNNITAIIIIESIIADRAQSYLMGKNLLKKDSKKFVSTSGLLDKIKLPEKIELTIKKKSKTINSTDLITEIKDWLKVRNEIIHSFAKSLPGTETISIFDYEHKALAATNKGAELVQLFNKWHNQQLAEHLKHKK